MTLSLGTTSNTIQVEGITFLHSAGIVYRNLNPGNVVIDASGHIVLTNFDSAEIMASGLGGENDVMRTLCGAKEFLAPEVLLGWAHDFSVDCWSLGILLYVMLFGRVRPTCSSVIWSWDSYMF